MRPIDADALIEVVEKSMAENPHKEKTQRAMHIHEHKYFLTLLTTFPTIQPEERTEKRAETRACDSIGRQVAIDAVDTIGHIATMPDGDKCIRRSAVKYTLSMLPPAQPEQRWIPVSERLPELNEDGYSQKVLACFGNCSGCDILEYRATEGIGKWYIGDMDDSPEDIGVMVLAWMPLPEPYKGVER